MKDCEVPRPILRPRHARRGDERRGGGGHECAAVHQLVNSVATEWGVSGDIAGTF